MSVTSVTLGRPPAPLSIPSPPWTLFFWPPNDTLSEQAPQVWSWGGRDLSPPWATILSKRTLALQANSCALLFQMLWDLPTSTGLSAFGHPAVCWVMEMSLWGRKPLGNELYLLSKGLWFSSPEGSTAHRAGPAQAPHRLASLLGSQCPPRSAMSPGPIQRRAQDLTTPSQGQRASLGQLQMSQEITPLPVGHF